MKEKLSKLIETYVQASNEKNVKAYVSCFTKTATVSDDGETLSGHDAIGEWFAENEKKYNSTTEPLSVKETADQIIMRAKVSGTFEGSPVTFDYYMDLKSGLIQNLKIDFVG